MPAYYNEIDSKAAAWLRELIKQGHIAPGEVDERSIEDVTPTELMEFTQCHFFAGIGVWSYALRQAGWPDDRPVWTGSCPCQPFSAAGKGGGFADERHLWPAFHHLISECRPSIVFGEQVASKDGLAWLDLVQVDLEGTGYTVGAVDTCAAGFGAPHIRQRLYWVADAKSSRRQYVADVHGGGGARNQSPEQRSKSGIALSVSSLADSDNSGLEGWGVGWDDTGQVSFGPSSLERQRGHEPRRHHQDETQPVASPSSLSNLADASSDGHSPASQSAHFRRLEQQSGREAKQDECIQSTTECCAEFGGLEWALPGPVNGFWGDADWLFCRDGKWRSVEPGTFPLVDGAPARVGRSGDFVTPEYSAQTTEARIARLRGYGNAIVAQVAQAFIEAYLDLEV